MDDGALIVVERSGEGGDFALDRPVEGRIAVEDEHAGVVIAIRRCADGGRGDGHGRGRFGRRLRGRLGGRLGAVDILFQIVLRAGGEHAVGREYLVAVVGVDLTLEVDDGLRGGRSVHAVGIVEQAEDDQLLLHEADGLRVGVGVHEYIVVLVAGLLGGLLCRLLGGLLRRLLGGLLGHGVVHVVFQQAQRGLVAVAGDGEGGVALLGVGPHLEVAHGDGGGRAVDAVHAVEIAEVAQHRLQIADALGGGIGRDARLLRGRGRGGRGGGRGRRGGGGRGRGPRLLPPVGKDDQVVARGGIDLAGHFQHLAAVVVVDKVLELPDRAARGRAVNAVVRAGGELAEGDEQLLHAADVALRGMFVDEEVVRRFGDHRRQRGRALRGLGRDLVLVEPVERGRAGDAVHGELGVDGVGVVHIGLEIAHGLAGGAVIRAGGLARVQPAEGDQLPLQVGDLRGRGIAVDDLAGRARRGVRPRGGRAHVAGLVVVVLVLILAGDVVHPGKIRIGDGRERGLHIGRGRGRGGRRPQRIRGQRGHGRGFHGGVQRAGYQADDDEGHHQHRQRRAADDQRQLLFGTPLALFLLAAAGGVGGGLALGDVGGAVLLKVEVALFRVFHGLHAGAQALHALFKGVLRAGHGRDGAVVQAAGAVARQVFADAQRALALGIVGHVDDAGGVLPHGAADEKAAVVEQRAGQKLYLRHGGAGIAAAVGADVAAVEILETVHALVFVCHGVHSFVFRQSATARCVRANTSSIVPEPSTTWMRSGSLARREA